MKKIIQCLFAGMLCVFLMVSAPLAAQDASHPQTAASQDTSDWGLLGLIGLIGLLGLRKKKEPEE